jgi:hypothetical protein
MKAKRLDMVLTLDQKLAEQVFNGLSHVEEHIVDGWNMPKTTTRYGKDVRCERIEMPYQMEPTYVCYLLNFGIDDAGAVKKVS